MNIMKKCMDFKIFPTKRNLPFNPFVHTYISKHNWLQKYLCLHPSAILNVTNNLTSFDIKYNNATCLNLQFLVLHKLELAFYFQWPLMLMVSSNFLISCPLLTLKIIAVRVTSFPYVMGVIYLSVSCNCFFFFNLLCFFCMTPCNISKFFILHNQVYHSFPLFLFGVLLEKPLFN